MGTGLREANARRIVACVNACAGIPTERLEEGVVREMAALLEAVVPPEGDDEWWCPTCEEWIPGGRVTAAECCDTCGTYLGGINDPEWVEKARALLAKARGEASPWLPFATAPKDGRWFLAYRMHDAYMCIARNEGVFVLTSEGPKGHWHDACFNSLDDDPPTHWMPLPEPPEDGEAS